MIILKSTARIGFVVVVVVVVFISFTAEMHGYFRYSILLPPPEGLTPDSLHPPSASVPTYWVTFT